MGKVHVIEPTYATRRIYIMPSYLRCTSLKETHPGCNIYMYSLSGATCKCTILQSSCVHVHVLYIINVQCHMTELPGSLPHNTNQS